MTGSQEFTALVIDGADSGVAAGLRRVREADLPEGEVTVAVRYSAVNYKDGLVLAGLGGLVKAYPHVPGIDFAGVVERSDLPRFRPGDPVILTGYRVGETRWGGYAERARVPADWLVPLPAGLSLEQAMALGTAGLTAMLAVMALEDHGLSPEGDAEVLVTGAAGGVGGIALAILAARGYLPVAVTGRMEQAGYLRELGAAEVLPRASLKTPPEGPLASARWAGAVDAVGGGILANLLPALRPGAACAAVGLAAGAEMTVSLIPFLLRGVGLLGIDSVFCPMARRLAAWQWLADHLPKEALARATTVIPLAEVPRAGKDILTGGLRGRTVVEIAG